MNFMSAVSLLCTLAICHSSSALAYHNTGDVQTQLVPQTVSQLQVTNDNDIPVPDGVPNNDLEINPNTGAC